MVEESRVLLLSLCYFSDFIIIQVFYTVFFSANKHRIMVFLLFSLPLYYSPIQSPDLGLLELQILHHWGSEHVIGLHVCRPLPQFVAFLVERNRWSKII